MNGISDMQVQQTTEQKQQVINTPRLLQTMKGLGPRSYEKAFQGFTHEDVLKSMSMALSGITREQVTIGLNTMLDQGYCPDPIMFRKWCLGIKGFVGDADHVKDSYKGKHAAIANIEAWRTDRSVSITNAEREAYNRVYGMFQDLQYANNYEKQKFYAYEAFKDAYAEVVKELVEKGEKQELWIQPEALEQSKPKSVKKDYLSQPQTKEEKENIQKIIEETKKAIKR